ncbi:hypothetical protein BJV78DRAFT_1131065 [Lactifluus subvellereus]|nr:hypothetical protein BJV78DRAFT_1131065 [Lactifluus subvellereus]
MSGKKSDAPFLHEANPRKPRTLVLCFDGTGNKFGSRNTNVVKLYSILKKDNPGLQICYYQECSSQFFFQAGIGTYFQPGVVSPMFHTAAQALDLMFAWYLKEHIIDGYKFLMQNYHEGDTVCIFGFSRGAFTARALAGMLHKVGLLSKDNFEQIPFAYELYKSSKRKSHKLANRFKKSFCRNVPIDFLGVWDTVASFGFLNAGTLPFVGTNDMIRVFRQALSLDERRAKFRPNLYHRPIVAPGPELQQTQSPLKRVARSLNTFKGRKTRCPDTSPDSFSTNHYANDLGFETNIQEVWFAGCHSDVGGGNAKDSERHALSNIPLRWMLREILNSGCRIHFDPTELKHLRDELKKKVYWWILEVFPTYYKSQNEEGQWIGNCHWGSGRELPPHPVFHESVRTRMRDSSLYYSPRAQYVEGSERYIE